MGDVSVIARRLQGGYVQYGWSGNGGTFSNVGIKLLLWYTDQEQDVIEDLFAKGQFSRLGEPNPRNEQLPWWRTFALTGQPHYLGQSEDDIFSKIMFVDHAYFYDLDHEWYYICPYIANLKVPLKYMGNTVTKGYSEFQLIEDIWKEAVKYMTGTYASQDPALCELIEKCETTPAQVRETLLSVISDDTFGARENATRSFAWLRNYFDRWIVVKTDPDQEHITGFGFRTKCCAANYLQLLKSDYPQLNKEKSVGLFKI